MEPQWIGNATATRTGDCGCAIVLIQGTKMIGLRTAPRTSGVIHKGRRLPRPVRNPLDQFTGYPAACSPIANTVIHTLPDTAGARDAQRVMVAQRARGLALSTLRAITALLVLSGTCPAAWAQTPAPQSIFFRDACASGDRVTVAAVGDLLFHFNLQQQALAKDSSFARLWQPVAPILRRADIVYGNLEGPAARGVTPGGQEIKLAPAKDDRAYDRRFYSGGESGVLVFNFHPSAVADVRAGGFDIVSTANNHAADRGPLGIDRTIDALEAAGLAHTGTRRQGESAQARPWGTITRAKGFAVAWLACTYGTNGMPDPHAQVLGCFGPRVEPAVAVLDEIARLAADPGIDAVILTPHWGNEYQSHPDESQRRLAHAAIEAGAAAVVGSHPHVLQPWERYEAPDGREGLIVYSSGNFISAQLRVEQRSGLISLLEFTREPGGRARLTAAGYVPTWVDFASPWRVVENAGTVSPAALASTMRLLPPGNRVQPGVSGALPKACGAEVVVVATTPGETPATVSVKPTPGEAPALVLVKPTPGETPATVSVKPTPGETPATVSVKPTPGETPPAASQRPEEGAATVAPRPLPPAIASAPRASPAKGHARAPPASSVWVAGTSR
jgi:poly-gamma-glutamate synthesis protein (capsule biosynthesis protein)